MRTGVTNCHWIHHLRTVPIIDNTMRIEDGFAYPRQGAGWGFGFVKKFLTEIR